jgi:hypothetical protein
MFLGVERLSTPSYRGLHRHVLPLYLSKRDADIATRVLPLKWTTLNTTSLALLPVGRHGRVQSDSAVSLMINMLTGVIVPKPRVNLYARYVMWMIRYFTFYVYVIALLSVIYGLMRSLQ